MTTQTLRREWFLEQRDGNCRLLGSFAKQLSETAPMWDEQWRRSRELRSRYGILLANQQAKDRLYRRALPSDTERRSEGRGNTFRQRGVLAPPHQKICAVCGAEGIKGRYCGGCAVEAARMTMADIASLSHMKPKSKRAKARLSRVLSNHAVANTWWDPTESVDYAQGKRTKLHEGAPNSKTN